MVAVTVAYARVQRRRGLATPSTMTAGGCFRGWRGTGVRKRFTVVIHQHTGVKSWQQLQQYHERRGGWWVRYKWGRKGWRARFRTRRNSKGPAHWVNSARACVYPNEDCAETNVSIILLLENRTKYNGISRVVIILHNLGRYAILVEARDRIVVYNDTQCRLQQITRNSYR